MFPARLSILGLCCLLAVGGVLVRAPAGAEQVSQPKLVVEESRYAFGSVPRGTLIKKKFSLRNAGSATLIIQKADFSTPGMRLRVAQQIEPGKTAEMEVQWDTSSYTREVEGNVVLQLNDPATPRLAFTLTGTVISPIDILPVPAFYLSQFQGETISQDIVIRNNQDRALKITKLEKEGAHFSIAFKPVEEGKTFTLTATAASAAPVGRYREFAMVDTDDAERPRLRIEVNLLVKPDVYLNVEALDFGQISIGKLKANPGSLDYLTQTFIVTRRQGQMRIVGFDSDVPFIKTRIEPGSAAQTFRVDAGLDPAKLKPGNYAGRLRLSTDDKKFPELNVPVQISLTP
jgi:hypothetical protein